MFSIGLVLSAGGSLGDPWHSGVLARLSEITDWDPRTADLIVGTSAGAFTGSALRAGLDAADCAARHTGDPLSAAGQAIAERIVTPYEEPVVSREWRPASPKMSLRALWPPWKADPARLTFGALPSGTRSGEAIASRINELLPGRWPSDPLWVVAVRSDDGRRIVFGRDDVRGSLGQAVQASSAIPAVYTPVKIGSRTYIDGAVHSATNTDLVATLGFDLVITSSVMTASASARSWVTGARRAWFGNKLDEELDQVRSRGTATVTVQPDEVTLTDLDASSADGRVRALEAGRDAVDRLFAGTGGPGARALIERAALAG